VEQAIERTLPTRAGERYPKVFELARELKALPRLTDAEPLALRPVVKEWHRRALPVIRTKAFDVTYSDFLRGWKRVKIPAGSGPLEAAMERARKEELPPEARNFDDPKVRLLVALCRQLHRTAGGAVWFLACRSAGKLLGIHYKTAWRWLVYLEDVGLLERVSTGNLKTKKANEYRYLG
jgi:hypothetical protein